MNNGLICTQSVTIQASAIEVWKALTTPRIIAQYLFGTNTTSDFKKGSRIEWQGEWQGKKYVDKGEILESVHGRELKFTYWSSNSGKPDTIDNYKTVSYRLSPSPNGTEVVLTQDGNVDKKERDHAAANWRMVLDGLKKAVESASSQ